MAIASVVICALLATTSLPSVWRHHQAVAEEQLRLQQTQETLAKMKQEIAEQQTRLQTLAQAPAQAVAVVQSSGGYSDADVDYWRKQMSAFGQMTGLRLHIAGRGQSPYLGATKINVQIQPTGKAALTAEQLVRALDFLQLYGFVETFSGQEAVVHVKGFGDA